MIVYGALLLALGAALLVFEAHFVTAGVAGVAGLLCLVGGLSLLLTGAGLVVALSVVIACIIGGVLAVLFALVAVNVIAVRRRRIRGGAHGLIGHVGTLRQPCDPLGQVAVDGAVWRARRLVEDPETLVVGDPVVVERVNGLTLSIRRAEDWELD